MAMAFSARKVIANSIEINNLVMKNSNHIPSSDDIIRDHEQLVFYLWVWIIKSREADFGLLVFWI
jgi:hypothetical protein